jgi:hypothetical protein
MKSPAEAGLAIKRGDLRMQPREIARVPGWDAGFLRPRNPRKFDGPRFHAALRPFAGVFLGHLPSERAPAAIALLYAPSVQSHRFFASFQSTPLSRHRTGIVAWRLRRIARRTNSRQLLRLRCLSTKVVDMFVDYCFVAGFLSLRSGPCIGPMNFWAAIRFRSCKHGLTKKNRLP